MRIAVVAPAGRITPELAVKVQALAADTWGARAPEIVFHPQCFLSAGHFAGDDAARASALVEVANDKAFDAVWFARGGYGSNRIARDVIEGLGPVAREKQYLGYSDNGFLLAGLYRAGFPRLAHGPVPADLNRTGGEAALARALRWLIDGAADALEPSLARDGAPAAAFNLCVLSHLVGTALEPVLDDHVLMLEEVSEYHYQIDRSLFHLTTTPGVRRVAGIRLGRCSQIPDNDPPFGQDEDAICRHWCEVSGVQYLGRADIGHDVENKVVPFGVR